jgi:hypothetical protein
MLAISIEGCLHRTCIATFIDPSGQLVDGPDGLSALGDYLHRWYLPTG